MADAGTRLGLFALAVLAGCATREPRAFNPYTADQVERLLRGAVPAVKVLADARRECIAFEVTPAHDAAFARAGAPQWFADSIRTACRADALGETIP